MCKCTPSIRTPFCGKPGCEWPRQDSYVVEISQRADLTGDPWMLCVMRGASVIYTMILAGKPKVIECTCEGPRKIGPGHHAPYCASLTQKPRATKPSIDDADQDGFVGTSKTPDDGAAR